MHGYDHKGYDLPDDVVILNTMEAAKTLLQHGTLAPESEQDIVNGIKAGGLCSIIAGRVGLKVNDNKLEVVW